MRIKAVVFDYGGVLSRDQDKETFSVMADIAGVEMEAFRGAYWESRKAYDRGAAGLDVWTGVLAGLGRRLPEEQIEILIKLDILSWSLINPQMLRWAHAVSLSGRRTAICSNIPPELAAGIFDNRFCCGSACLPVPLVFDPVVKSCSIGSIKPEPEIYRYLLEKLSLPPDEILFLDDREENAVGARALGIRAEVFKSFDKLMKALPAIDPSLPLL